MPKKMSNRYAAIWVSVGIGIGIVVLGLFALGASATRAAVSTASVDLVKTVGTIPEACATTKSIAVHRGTEVFYCYMITNTGDENLKNHTLVDDQLGLLIEDNIWNFPRGEIIHHVVSTTITESVTNTATWTSYDPDLEPVRDMDSATVTLLPPELELVKTVGLGPGCATTTSLDVARGTEVTYCYKITNTGADDLITHDLVDDRLGILLDDFSYTVALGESFFITRTAVISESVTNHATWSAQAWYDGKPTGIASDEATAHVTVVPPSLALSKTVGTDPSVCATTDAIEVSPFTPVTNCYEVTNTGLDALVMHGLEDDQLGTILDGFSYNLVPGASVYFVETAVISESVINSATWSSDTTDGRTASGSDTAQVTVVPPTLELVKTVGLDPAVCATTDSVSIEEGEEVTYCYVVRNTGISNLVTHNLVDDELGTILPSFAYDLAPDASVYHLVTVPITNSVLNTATWSALTPEGAEASGSATARVLVAGDPLYALFLPMLKR